jgi:hypothetical protein
MTLYRYLFLDKLAKQVGEQRLHAVDDADAVGIAGILAGGLSVAVLEKERWVAVVVPGRDTGWVL